MENKEVEDKKADFMVRFIIGFVLGLLCVLVWQEDPKTTTYILLFIAAIFIIKHIKKQA